MAAALVGGAFLSATVQTLVEKLASTEFLDYIRNTKLNVSLLRQLQTTLLTLQTVLNDAEQKQIKNPDVKQWLDNLKDAVFDAEDLLNQISYDSLRCKIENTEAGSKTKKFLNFLSSPFNNFYREINSQMKIMCERLQFFAQQKDTLGLQQTVSDRVSHRISSSLVIESDMVGRKDDKETIMNMLISDNITSTNNLGVIAILGMGGLGKTTLAQLVYNEKKVQDHFDHKAWVCVSQDFDILRVTKCVFESVTKKPWESDNLDLLRVELKKNLREKRFFIVLDDLWNDNYHDWKELVTPLISGKTGSRVIITTRQRKVAAVARTFPILELQPLSEEENWCLLKKHAFGGEDFCGTEFQKLEAIGRKIARKCRGLPIAAKTLGGLLRSKVDVKEWTSILKSDIWELENDDILPALHLSYQYLPSHLKRCFAYCSIFPKGCSLDRKQLVLLWMAEGFLVHSQGEKTMEEIGDDFFAELLSRSLIQLLNDEYVMHDLVNDLATVVSGISCYRFESCSGSDTSENVRHLSYNKARYDIFEKFKMFNKFKCLRTFLSINSWWEDYYLSRKVIDDLLPTLGKLRVLSLSKYCNITELPDSIGNLVQLRYLDLSFTKIKSLPDTICNLYFLQTLILSQCSNLAELPEHIGKLINLRHLDIDLTSIAKMPKQIVELENLQTLTIFVVGKQKVGLSVKELERFPKLRGKLTIKNVQNVIDIVEAYDTNLKSKENVEELTLQWGCETNDTLKVKHVLDVLQPSTNLKKLRIDLYGGTSFPSWLGDSSFSNMVSICINNCANCAILPPLGQLPSLNHLQIGGMTMLEKIEQEFYGRAGGGINSSFQPFPSLETLVIENMSNWKDWFPFQDDICPFPRLKTLKLSQCPELRGYLPNHLPSIEEIEIYACDNLLATQPTQNWLSSIKLIVIEGDSDSKHNTERTQCSLLENDSPCILQGISITSCHLIKSVPKMVINSTCLRELNLDSIPSLTAFPTNGLPTSLVSLRISDCNNLTLLPLETWRNYTSLVYLELWNSCDALTSFLLNGFPMLQKLYINRCRGLESIFTSETSSCIWSSLHDLYVGSCEALRSLPQRMDTLTTLHNLHLSHLPNLELSFCEGAWLPPNLENFYVKYVRTKPITEWGLQGLTTLSFFSINGDDAVKTVATERLLPISLDTLTLRDLLGVKLLEGNGLRHLSSLKTLDFHDCWLESISDDMLPSSLKTLECTNCAILKSLPEDNLPSSLKMLEIRDCPLLEERYKKKEHWSKIAHIPVIKINDKVTICN